MNCVELLNSNIAIKLLINRTYYESLLDHSRWNTHNGVHTYPSGGEDTNYSPFDQLSRFFNAVPSQKSISGKKSIEVLHEQRCGRGRFFANESLSLQSMHRTIRGTLSGEYYNDIDIVNCHPQILLQLCLNANIECSRLTEFCDRRDMVVKELGVLNPTLKLEDIKHGVLSIINNGNAFYDSIKKNMWIEEFYTEVKHSIKTLALANPELYAEMVKSKKDNPIGSTVNNLFCAVENDLLNIMIAYFKDRCIIDKKLNNYVPCFDGIMIPKGNYDIDTCMRKIEREFTDFGFPLKLKNKPFQTINLEIPEEHRLRVIDDDVAECENRFDYKDKYTFLDFYGEMNGRTFPNKIEMLNYFNARYKKVITKIHQGDTFYIKKGIKEPEISKGLGLSNFKTYHMELQGRELVQKKQTLSDLLDDKKGFGEITCDLDNDSVKKTSFNLWGGFLASRVDLTSLSPPVQEGLDMMKDFLLKVWSNNDSENYRYIISWFAGLFTNTTGINRSALVMVSTQGCGKNTMTDFMKNIINTSNVAEFNGISGIVQKHNTAAQNIRLGVINEMSSTKEEFRSSFDKLKPFISDECIQIEPKGVNPYKIKNIGNYILFTNHPDSIIVEDSDRRYAIFQMSDCYMNNVPYFTQLRKMCFNRAVADAFYTYLLDFAETVPLSIIPNTELRQEMKLVSKSSVEKFIDYVYDGEDIEECVTSIVGTTVGAGELYSKYLNFCARWGERNSVSKTKFGVVVKKVWEYKRSNGMKYFITPRIE